jgi:hypothetical protein
MVSNGVFYFVKDTGNLALLWNSLTNSRVMKYAGLHGNMQKYGIKSLYGNMIGNVQRSYGKQRQQIIRIV